MPALKFLDSAAVRRWCGLAAEALGAVREQLNELNVFPVPDSDTGTNLHVTMLSAVRALDELPETAGPQEVWQALAHGVLLGAQGNSGVIVSQFLRGLADVCAPASPCDGAAMQQALAYAAGLSRAAVGEPVEGTVLTVASAGAASAASAGKSLAAVARAAAHGARMELARTTAKLDALARAGVVDAGGAGLCVLLDALAVVVTGAHAGTYVIPAPIPPTAPIQPVALAPSALAPSALAPSALAPSALAPSALAPSALAPSAILIPSTAPVLSASAPSAVSIPSAASAASAAPAPPAAQEVPGATAELAPAGAVAAPGAHASASALTAGYEVMYLLEAADEPVALLRDQLGRLGNSLVVAGGQGLWNVHVHVADAGAAIEAGIAAGRPYRIRVTHLGVAGHVGEQAGAGCSAQVARAGAVAGTSGGAVVAIVGGAGIAALFEAAGAVVIHYEGGRAPRARELLDAVLAAGAATGQVAVLPDSPRAAKVVGAVAEQARGVGLAVLVLPTRSAVQSLAALAVHDEARAFDADVTAMSDAATATRWGRLTWSQPAGQARPVAGGYGQSAGSLGDNVVAQGADPVAVAVAVAGGLLTDAAELVTLITGSPPGRGAPAGGEVAAAVAAYTQATQPGIEVVTHDGGDPGYLLLIGVE
jgi:dihydroxyacetone kinase-like predicted kinase